MTLHSCHEDVHETGLADGCPRCRELAETPFLGLDNRMLAALVQRIRSGQRARTESEAIAMARVRDGLLIVEKLAPFLGCEIGCSGGLDCSCYQAGLEAQREPAGRGTA